MIRRSDPKWLSHELCVALCKLLNLNELVLVNVRETLPRVGGRPPHLQPHNLRRLAKTNVLLDGIGAEGAAAANGAVNRARSVTFIRYGRLDARPDSRAV